MLLPLDRVSPQNIFPKRDSNFKMFFKSMGPGVLQKELKSKGISQQTLSV